MKKINELWQTLKSRWHNAMPRFFKRMMWICGIISGAAIAIHESFAQLGIQPHDWWMDAERYLIGGSVGAMAVCKLTQSYDKDGKPLEKELPDATQPSSVNNSDVETQQPNDIEPNNEIE